MDRTAPPRRLHRKISVSRALVVGLTPGDPAGIGPELVQQVAQRLRRQFQIRVICMGKAGIPGRPAVAGARQARLALEESVRLLKRQEIHAVVNGPISKEWMRRAGFAFPGQTEFYAKRFGEKPGEVTMCMVGPRLKVALASTHVALARAVKRLRPPAIVRAGLHLAELLKMIGIQRPRIAVCGLNPHAGEGGLFGDEERRVVIPAIRALRKKLRLKISGPEPADTVFRRAMGGDFDGVVALYHDQALIPAKLLDFDRTVNVTLGLPVIRCSPDHGTAFGLAGKGKAKPNSMIEAVKLAAILAEKKR